MGFRKAQTATEYLIILAVVIILALIVVGVLGGIPGIGGSTGTNTNSLYWQTAAIGVTGLKASVTENHSITLKNNLQDTISIDFIAFGEQLLKTDDYNMVLKPGQSFTYESRFLDGAIFYYWLFKDCLWDTAGWGNYNYHTHTFTQTPIVGNGVVTVIGGVAGDTFSETLAIQYTNQKTGAVYNWVSEEPLTGTCAS